MPDSLLPQTSEAHASPVARPAAVNAVLALTAAGQDEQPKSQDPATTAANESGPASSRVINTVELLERVLLELPFRDLLLVSRVSKQFEAVVKGSIAIQRDLFLLAESPDGKPRLHPLFSPEKGFDRLGVSLMWIGICVPTPVITVRETPNIAVCPLILLSYDIDEDSGCVKLRYTHRSRRRDRGDADQGTFVKVSPRGSWRRMHLIQSGSTLSWSWQESVGQSTEALRGHVDGEGTIEETFKIYERGH